MNLKQYTPTLIECAGNDMMAVFERKVMERGAHGLVDYIGLSVQLLDDQIERLKIAKKEIDQLIKAATGQQEIIKINAAKYLSSNGIDKLEGDTTSSIKVNSKAPTKKLIIEDEKALIEAGYVKTVLDDKLVAETINAGEEVQGARYETTHNEDLITIYKRKG